MQVETYEVEEINGELGNMAADAEAQELIEKLGLCGQRELLNPETCTRFPYRLMTPVEHKVYSLSFPQRDKLEDFRVGIIPVRVLQVAAFVKENAPADMTAGLYVWHCGSAKEDPLLVGHTQSYGGKFYLLARWGDALESFEKLTEKAKKIWMIKAKAKLEKSISSIREDLASMDSITEELFATGKCSSANESYMLENL